MKQKQTMGIYTCIWIVAIVILIVSLFQNLGYAKVINYSGIVRGATQKLLPALDPEKLRELSKQI